jgi:hypothetical protein
MNIGSSNNLDEFANLSAHMKNNATHEGLSKEDIKFSMMCIQYEQRLENEEEVKKRKEEAEKLAALEKNAKKKPPPKGQP